MLPRVNEKNLPVLATLGVCASLYVLGCVAYYQSNFASLIVLEQLFSGSSVLGIAAVGLTFVILSGGIDLSVASVVALSTMVVAALVARVHVNPWVAILAALAAGALLGFGTGCLIHFFELPPFLVTLATLFLARGICLVINRAYPIPLEPQKYPFFDRFTSLAVRLPWITLHPRGMLFIGIVLVGVVVAHWTRFGRNVYALGGNEQAARLMGLPVGRTKVLVYTISGFCAALAGIALLSDVPSGDPTTKVGMELDAIAAVVIGGTLLSGGVGYVFGTLLGVLILAMIEQLIVMDGRLDSSWARIVNGLLLFAFIALQKLLTRLRIGGNRSATGFPVVQPS